MVGQLLGANLLDKAKEYGRQYWKVAFGCGLVNVGLICIVGPLVYIFYVLEPQAKAYLVQMLVFSAFYMFAFAYNSIITCGVFPAGGDSRYDAISVALATWCFAVPLSFLGCFVFQWPVIIVYSVMCLVNDIPANCVAVGNPCKVVREIGEKDRMYYYKDWEITAEDLEEERRLR